MSDQWQLFRSARTFLEASTIANDALIALNFLSQNREKLKREDEERYQKNLSAGLELLEDMGRTLEAQRKGGKVSSKPLLILRAVSHRYLTVRTDELLGKVDLAVQEIRKFNQSEKTELRNAKELLGTISKATSEELSTTSLKVK